MARGALFVGWGAIIHGRERQAKRVLEAALGYCTRLRDEGVIEGFEAVALEPHGGELEGFVLVRGERDAIARLRVDPEFQRTIVGVQLVHAKVGVVGAYTGAEMGVLFGLWDAEEARLGL